MSSKELRQLGVLRASANLLASLSSIAFDLYSFTRFKRSYANSNFSTIRKNKLLIDFEIEFAPFPILLSLYDWKKAT